MPFFQRKKGIQPHMPEGESIIPKYSAAQNARANRKNISESGLAECILSVRELTLSYEGHEVISGLNFEIDAGEYLCIVGENGSGKSTLMNAVLGLKKPSSGRIELAKGLSHTEIGYLPQSSEHQKDFPASVYEIVLSGCINRRRHRLFYSREDKKIAFSNMERLGITPISHRSFSSLSGGQKQRVLLARALCASGRLLMLDEPVAGLDPKAMADMYSIIADVNKNEKMTVIMISHDIPSSLKYATKILDISKPQIFFGGVAEYLRTPRGMAYSSDTQVEERGAYGKYEGYKFKGDGEVNA